MAHCNWLCPSYTYHLVNYDTIVFTCWTKTTITVLFVCMCVCVRHDPRRSHYSCSLSVCQSGGLTCSVTLCQCPKWMTDRQTDRQTDRWMDGQTDRQTQTDLGRCTNLVIWLPITFNNLVILIIYVIILALLCFAINRLDVFVFVRLK